MALAWAPFGVSQNSQFLRPTVNGRIAFSLRLIIPLRRSRLSGKTETICLERRKPLQFIATCGKATCMLLCLRWVQSINLSHGNILFWIETHNRNLVRIKSDSIHDGICERVVLTTELLIPVFFQILGTEDRG